VREQPGVKKNWRREAEGGVTRPTTPPIVDACVEGPHTSVTTPMEGGGHPTVAGVMIVRVSAPKTPGAPSAAAPPPPTLAVSLMTSAYGPLLAPMAAGGPAPASAMSTVGGRRNSNCVGTVCQSQRHDRARQHRAKRTTLALQHEHHPQPLPAEDTKERRGCHPGAPCQATSGALSLGPPSRGPVPRW